MIELAALAFWFLRLDEIRHIRLVVVHSVLVHSRPKKKENKEITRMRCELRTRSRTHSSLLIDLTETPPPGQSRAKEQKNTHRLKLQSLSSSLSTPAMENTASIHFGTPMTDTSFTSTSLSFLTSACRLSGLLYSGRAIKWRYRSAASSGWPPATMAARARMYHLEAPRVEAGKWDSRVVKSEWVSDLVGLVRDMFFDCGVI